MPRPGSPWPRIHRSECRTPSVSGGLLTCTGVWSRASGPSWSRAMAPMNSLVLEAGVKEWWVLVPNTLVPSVRVTRAPQRTEDVLVPLRACWSWPCRLARLLGGNSALRQLMMSARVEANHSGKIRYSLKRPATIEVGGMGFIRGADVDWGVWTGALEGALKDWLQRKGSNLQPIG